MNSASQLYDVSTRLAIGGAGLIYKATERASGLMVVLKVLLPEEEISHPLDGEALLRDAPEISLMTGENIVRLLNAFQDEDGMVLVYEFADGTRGLDVPDTCPIPASEAVDIAAQLLAALHCGEEFQYPHGDLKPSDITLGRSPDGRPLVKVLDWGLANYRRESTPAALPYTAPERLHGLPPSHVADLFSAGAVLHYLFCGQQPVEAATKEEFAAAWHSLNPRTLHHLRPELPAVLVNLIARLLQPDPTQRPASAAEALSGLTAVESAPARPPQRLQTSRRAVIATSAVPRAGHPRKVIVRSARKRKSPAVFATSILLLLAFGAGGFVIWNNAQTGQKPELVSAPVRSTPPPPQAAALEPSPKTAPSPVPVVEPATPVAPAVAGSGGATFSSSAGPPAVDAADIANLTAQTVTDKWFFESNNEKGAADAAKGVIFETGDSPVLLKALTYKIATGSRKAATTEKPTTWTIRVGTVSRKNFTLIASARAEQTAGTGDGDYLTWTFATPVPLPADTTCAVDVAMRSRTGWTTGIPYLACSGNVTTPGVRESYHSGDHGEGGATIFRSEASDRIFHVDLQVR